MNVSDSRSVGRCKLLKRCAVFALEYLSKLLLGGHAFRQEGQRHTRRWLHSCCLLKPANQARVRQLNDAIRTARCFPRYGERYAPGSCAASGIACRVRSHRSCRHSSCPGVRGAVGVLPAVYLRHHASASLKWRGVWLANCRFDFNPTQLYCRSEFGNSAFIHSPRNCPIGPTSVSVSRLF